MKDQAVRGATNSMQNDRWKRPSSMLLRIWGTSRIVSGALLQYKAGHSKTRRFHAGSGDQRAQEHAFRSHDANFFRVHFDELGQRAEVVAAVSARLGLHAPAGLAGERFQRLRCDARPEPIKRTLGPALRRRGPDRGWT
jgi:hypothetical protein